MGRKQGRGMFLFVDFLPPVIISVPFFDDFWLSISVLMDLWCKASASTMRRRLLFRLAIEMITVTSCPPRLDGQLIA